MRKHCLGEGHAGSCSLGRTRERGEEREKNTTRAPSLNGPRFSPVGLGKGTKQSESKQVLEGERKAEVSSQQFGETCNLP